MRCAGLILLLSLAASAQSLDGIVTNVSRSVTLPPDEADFTVTVITTLDTTQDQVTQAFQNAGIQKPTVTLSGASQVYPSRGPAKGQLSYQITFTTAPSALAEYTKKLDSIDASLPDGFATLQYNAYLNASQASVDSAFQATLPQLVQDAQAKARLIAAAAGLKLGSIAAITDSGASGAAYISPLLSLGLSNGAYTFSATVRFAAQ